MKTVIDKANTRGYFNHGWLKTYHTFSFADYYNPRRIHFGALRVLTYIIHSGFISGYQNRYGDNLKPPTNVYHRMTA